MSLPNLKGQRTRLGKKISETIESCQKLVTSASPEEGLEGFSELIDTKIDVCNSLSARFEDISSKIVEAMGDDDAEKLEAEGEASIDVVIEIAETVSQLSSRQKKISEKLQRQDPQVSTRDGAVNDQLQKLIDLESAKQSRENKPPCNVNLPKLDFEPFSGEVLKWSEFWDSFSASVHLSQALQPVQKLAYLRAKLRGDAKAVIAGLETTNENYDVAVSLLRERFGDEQTAISAHYSQLMDLPPVPNHTTKLRSMWDSLEQHLRCLSSLGEDVNHRHFISMIMHKLPEPVIVKLEEMKGIEEPWSVKLLRSKLQIHLVAREAASRQGKNSSSRPGFGLKAEGWSSMSNKVCGHNPHRRSMDSFNGSQKQFATSEALYNGEKENSKIRRQPKCIFCNGGHWSDECRKYDTVTSRKKKLIGRCFNCLGKDHSARNCSSDRPCFHCKKKKDHHSSLCLKKFPMETETAHTAAEDGASETEEESLLASGEKALLQTALVDLVSTDCHKSLKVRLLFDSGSHRSYITEEVVNKLRLSSKGTETISVNTFGATKSKSVKTEIVDVSLKLQDKSLANLTVNVVPKISASIQRQVLDLSKYKKQLEGLKLADQLPTKSQSGRIDILIGSDYYLDFLTFERVHLGRNLYLLGSKFGWILTGRVPQSKSSTREHSMLILNINNQSVSQLNCFQPPDKSCPIEINTEDFWNLETIGIKETNEDSNDEAAISNFNSTVLYENGRYHVKWPWREEFPVLPSNFKLSFGRLNSLIRRLSTNSSLLQQYDRVIQDQLTKGIIEKVSNDGRSSSLVHYIPHQAVVTPQKTTTKIRVVYDASAKANKEAPSLNECLLRGPVILENLCGLLMRFRLHNIGIVADIEKAFLQVGIQEADRDVVRFLWLKNPSRCTTENSLQIYRFCRVPFGVISSPFLLSATVLYHLKQIDTDTASQIAQNMYVDNMITGVSNLAEAKDLYKNGKIMFRGASMNLREWTSNSKEFLSSVDEEDRCKETAPKVLGMVWHVHQDSLSISTVNCKIGTAPTSKRGVFKKIAQFFDPLGLLSPTLVRGKMFLQELWSQGFKWDDVLSAEQEKNWNELLQDLAATQDINIPRSLDIEFNEAHSQCSLMCFCDASSKAYATVVYLRWSNDGNDYKSSLIFSKSRLAPVKRQTIPRLELLAVLIGVRTLKFVENQLKLAVCQKVIWSDSQCVLSWIGSTRLQPVFIENRLKEIKSHKDVEYRFVRSEDNPADLPSRGISVECLRSSKLWWHGPKWITLSSSQWSTKVECVAKDVNKPASGPSVLFEASLMSAEETVSVPTPFGINIDSYSSLMRLLRVTAWCCRFISRCRQSTNHTAQFLSAQELYSARTLWERSVQRKHYATVFDAIASGKKNQDVIKYDLTVDKEGILRCGGRLRNAELEDEAKFPIILPRDDHFSILTIQHNHRKLLHAGTSQTLASLRGQYWIPQGRRQVQKVLFKCTICKRYEGGPYKVPPMPSLPLCRVGKATPFKNAGVDYFGPLYVKGTAGRKKTWVCLFTCMTVRAIHLELVPDLSADEFLMSFRRFVARRGTPALLISDNGSNFQAASKVVQTAWEDVFQDHDVQSYFSTSGIRWKFIPQFSPWMGGFYERLIGIVKRSLRKVLGRMCLGYVQLQTILTEVEAVVNCRPLVYIGSEFTNGYSLSPSHFLCLNPDIGHPSNPAMDAIDFDDPEYRPRIDPTNSLLEIWKKGQIHLNNVWLQWHRQYLVALRERYQKCLRQPHRTFPYSPTVGDIVLVKDDLLPRGSWKVAKVTALIPSADGQFRGATILFASGKETIRPLALLFPFECTAGKHDGGNDPYQLSEGDAAISTLKPNGSGEPSVLPNLIPAEHLIPSHQPDSDTSFFKHLSPDEAAQASYPVQTSAPNDSYDVRLLYGGLTDSDDEFGQLKILSHDEAINASSAVITNGDLISSVTSSANITTKFSYPVQSTTISRNNHTAAYSDFDLLYFPHRSSTSQVFQKCSTSKRLQRQAAKTANDNIHKWLKE